MVVVEVFLGLEGRGSIKLNHKIVGGHSGDTIIWNVHSVSSDATEVEVDFDRGKTYFLSSRGGAPSNQLKVPITGGFARLVGTIPVLSNPTVGGRTASTEVHKYTIRSIDSHQRIIAEKDPYVVPSDP